jgi:hypothetical protein
VLFEQRLGDGRWVGHAVDHVLVSAHAPRNVTSLENAIGVVTVTGIDPDVPDRTLGVVDRLADRPMGDASAA